MSKIEKLLGEGLEEGYAGATKRQTVQRGQFRLESSTYVSPEGGVYHDEWIADRTGGGQEIAQIGEKKTTRLYAGGTISVEELIELGLTKKDVTRQLKKFIKGSNGNSRLLAPYSSQEDDWTYDYHLIDSLPEIPLRVGMETIQFKGNLVFAHGFLHTSID